MMSCLHRQRPGGDAAVQSQELVTPVPDARLPLIPTARHLVNLGHRGAIVGGMS